MKRSKEPPGKEADDRVRRVLFELALDEGGALEWRIDPTIKPILLLAVAGSLKLAHDEIMLLLSEAINDDSKP